MPLPGNLLRSPRALTDMVAVRDALKRKYTLKCINVWYLLSNVQNFALLTDNSFHNKTSKNHLVGTNPFLKLYFDMISSFPLHYTHIVFLGVFKRLILIWTGQWHKIIET
jgi:hypothetical protein